MLERRGNSSIAADAWRRERIRRKKAELFAA
jgi:hypothetical protein